MVSIESAIPAASLAIVLAEAGRDQEGVAVGGHLEVADRVVLGLGSPGKAPRIGSRSNSEIRTGAPMIPSKEAAPTKRVAASVISTRTPWPATVARRANSSDL